MSWQLAVAAFIALLLAGGFAWFERSRPPARIVAAIAALAALGIAGRVALAPIPNVVATTDVALLAGYSFGGPPGFAVGALSGLISNFWLGQGPWTPWQMAGWGLVGLGGAALARASKHRLGRWQLAFAAALAGLLYGMLLDLSTMVTYGGEQSLDRYLALSARAVPFNIAHASGNFVLMLVAGPAMVRMLDRYRARFEFRWRASLGGTAALLLAALCALLPALAGTPSADAATGVKGAQKWLRSAQGSDGGFGTEPGATSSPGMTGWAMLGLEASGINPRDVRRKGKSPVAYLRANSDAIDGAGDLSRSILALAGAKVDPRSFGGRDLVAELRRRRGKKGGYDGQVNLTAFAILAQRAAGVERGKLGKSAAWLRSAQNKDGGWGSTRGGWSDPDSTGAALQALAVSPGGSGQMDRGVRWLERAQHGTGGWSLTKGDKSNSQSTAWAVQGLIAAGRAPGKVRKKGKSGIDYLHKRQASDGHYAYSSSSDQTPVWVTAQAIAATGREAWPVKPVDRKPRKQGGKANDDDNGSGHDSGDNGYTGNDGYTGDDGYDDSGYDDGIDTGDPGSRQGRDGAPGTDPGTGDRDASRQRIPADPDPGVAGEELAAAAEPAADEDRFHAPETPVLLGGLGGLTALLGGGFLWLRRRLP